MNDTWGKYKCSVSECNRKRVAKGFCDKHYRRFKKYGDPSVVTRFSNKNRLCSGEGCNKPAIAKGLCPTHLWRLKKHGDPNKLLQKVGSISTRGYYRRTINGKEKLKHIEVAEKMWGGPLPDGFVVHHKNGNKLDNNYNNIIPLPSASFHSILHRLQKAMKECGHPDWRKCAYCHQWDDKQNLVDRGDNAYHKECHRDYYREYYHKKYAKGAR